MSIILSTESKTDTIFGRLLDHLYYHENVLR